MRIISQNSMIDVPYEVCAFSIGENINGFNIYARSKFLDEKPCLYATYKSEEKALKAMEMLRDAYVGMPVIMQNVEVADEVIEKLKKQNVICAKLPEEKSSIEYVNNTYFKFPKDNDVEV